MSASNTKIVFLILLGLCMLQCGLASIFAGLLEIWNYALMYAVLTAIQGYVFNTFRQNKPLETTPIIGKVAYWLFPLWLMCFFWGGIRGSDVALDVRLSGWVLITLALIGLGMAGQVFLEKKGRLF